MRRQRGWTFYLFIGAALSGACGSDSDGSTPGGASSSGSSGSSGSSSSGGASSSGSYGTPTPPSAVKTCAPTCPVTNVAQGAWKPSSLTLFGDNVYFITTSNGNPYENRGVYSVPKAGGEARKLAQIDGGGANCKQLATDGAYVYFTSDGVERVSVQGGPIEALSPAGKPGSHCVAVDDTHVYWQGESFATGVQERGFFKTPKNGGPPVLVAKDESAGSAHSFIVRDGTLYITGDTTLKSVPTSGGSFVTLAGQLEFTQWRAEADAAFVYLADKNDGVVQRVPVKGGPPEVLADDDRARGLFLDGSTLYWSRLPNDSTEHRIVMLELGAPKPPDPELAGVPIVSTVDAVEIVADATHIYWASEAEGAIRKVAK